MNIYYEMIRWQNEKFNLRFVLPTTINKYFDWKEIKVEEFRKAWRARKPQHIIRSEIFELNRKVAKGIIELKKYFPTLVDLKPHQEIELVKGNGHYSLGGMFYLSHSEEMYQVKIILIPGHRVVFKMGLQTAVNDEVLKIEEYIMYTFWFLLCK